MVFLYTTIKLKDDRIKILLFDFVCGHVQVMYFDDERYLDVTQQLHAYLKDISFYYTLRYVDVKAFIK